MWVFAMTEVPNEGQKKKAVDIRLNEISFVQCLFRRRTGEAPSLLMPLRLSPGAKRHAVPHPCLCAGSHFQVITVTGEDVLPTYTCSVSAGLLNSTEQLAIQCRIRVRQNHFILSDENSAAVCWTNLDLELYRHSD